MSIKKEATGHGVPWEESYGYAQGVKVGNIIYLSGQLSHDDNGEFVAPAPLDDNGNILDSSNMAAQMRQTYANASKILDKYGASLSNAVEEVVYVTDMDAAMAVAGEVRKEAYGSDTPAVCSTILVTPRLALPPQLVEIKIVAHV